MTIKRFLGLFRMALAGEHQDYTSGSIRKAIFMLSVPMVMEMMMESIFFLVDAYFVSSLGANAIATVGLTESVLTLVYAIAIGLSMGVTAIVARRVGEKDLPGAGRAAVQAIFLGVLVAAMKCKQTVDAGSAKALRDAILKFYEAYEGKKPQLD